MKKKKFLTHLCVTVKNKNKNSVAHQLRHAKHLMVSRLFCLYYTLPFIKTAALKRRKEQYKKRMIRSNIQLYLSLEGVYA